ncbi:hypothetical protein ABZ360_04445 [Streptomyces althioticus]
MSTALYETHVTVRCSGSGQFERLRRWSAVAGLKLTRIELARGRMRDQPMLTLAGARSLAEESARARDVVARLRAESGARGGRRLRVRGRAGPARQRADGRVVRRRRPRAR